MPLSAVEVENFLSTIPSFSRGPGGAVAIIRDGELISRRTWGYANLEHRIRMTEHTLMPICSISKHMLVLILIDLVRNFTLTTKEKKGNLWQELDKELRKTLPQLFEGRQTGGRQLKVEDLFSMQSGIRDYWAMTVLWGARPEDPFSITDHAPKALERTRSFHFTPGSEYSYSNVNFHILGHLVQKLMGRSLGQLLSQHLFIPAGMSTADLCPNTAGIPLPIVGYEGTEDSGYTPAVNRIEWAGDAGIVASLRDMIAYEEYLHRSWDDKHSLYSSIAESATFDDGSWASYSHGLWHEFVGGQKTLGHTGALRGFRMERKHLPKARLSVIVMLNHEARTEAVTERVLKFLLGVATEEAPFSVAEAAKTWEGNFFTEEQQRVISVELSQMAQGEIIINYDGSPESVKLSNSKTAESSIMQARIEGNILHIVRPGENVKLVARRIHTTLKGPISQLSTPLGLGSEYYCDEVDSTFTCDDSGSSSGIVYGAFTGFLGLGPAYPMRYIDTDIWILKCPRSMDAPSPGEWTIVFRRDSSGRVKSATIGCWLARKLEFVRKS